MAAIFDIFKQTYKRFNSSIRNKLAFCFMLIILLLLFVTFYSSYNLSVLLKQYDKSLFNYSILNDFFANNIEVHALLKNYFVTGSEGAYNEYIQKYNKAYKLLKQFKSNMKDDNSMGKAIDLERMMQTYGDNAFKALESLKTRETVKAYKYLEEAENISTLIDTRFRTYFNIQFKMSEQERNDLLRRRDQQVLLNYLIILFSIVFCTAFVMLFSSGITKPISELVKNAEKISRGDFDVEPINPVSRDEMHILSGVFNNMVDNIRFFISEMDKKSKLQQKLISEENKNLKMEALLKETQLRALQAQINPHFLFNTLNMINRTAYIEEANQTRELLEATADLLRYNLDRTDKAVTLKDEIACAENYLYIQRKRFGDRIRFEMEVPQDLEDIMVPALIIQPLIENAIVHGVDQYIHDGRVTVCVVQEQDRVVIEVKDNGVGMEEEQIRRIMSANPEDVFANNHGSIGVNNVKKRLELFFGRKDVFQMDSVPGSWTAVKLLLPIAMEFERGGRDV